MILYSDPAYGYKEGIAMTQTQAFPPFKKLSFYSETHTVALPYTIASTGQNTERMETAKDILENHGITEKSTDSYFYERALKSMREITELTYDQFNPLIVMDCGCDVCKMNQRKKYTFMKSLFPQ